MNESSPLGVLELTSRNSGFLRRREAGYFPSRDDIHVGQRLVQQYNLRTGDEIAGEVGKRPGRGKSPPLQQIVAVNGRPPEELRHRTNFSDLTATHPKERLVLECELMRLGQPDYTNRIIDLLCPFGKGQRALIVAPAKAGKTMMLQAIAEGIVRNQPNAFVLILLVDERPEEITEMESCGYGEVVASSFDFPPDRHVAITKLQLERARRRVELGQDVVIVLDSITRLARAHNKVGESSGRTLTGGLDATSMDQPKKFLGSARYIDPKQEGGSLTIIGTALIDTGSKMDQVIFEEFKGTGNSELVLSREIAERRVFPAIDLTASATRREELLLSDDALQASHAIRRRLAAAEPVEAMSHLLYLMKQAKTNAELIHQVLSER